MERFLEGHSISHSLPIAPASLSRTMLQELKSRISASIYGWDCPLPPPPPITRVLFECDSGHLALLTFLTDRVDGPPKVANLCECR